jgi:spermidine/putrescine transport system substrate-binding protein
MPDNELASPGSSLQSLLENRTLTRRGFVGVAVGVGVAMVYARAGVGAVASGAKISMLTWETYDEPSWLTAYEKQHTDVSFNRSVIGSVDEMFAKVRSGAVKFDLLYFDSGSIERYRQAKLIAPLDASKVPNAANIPAGLPWKKTNIVNGRVWGLPYNWGITPIMYNADHIKKPPTSWAALWDPAYRGKVSTFDDAYVNLPMVSLYLGQKNLFKLTDKQFAAVRIALKKLRPQLVSLATGFNDQQNLFASGEAVIGYCFNISEVYNLQAKGMNIRVTIPKEGTPTWIDNSVITPNGHRPEVYAFINATMGIPWQKRFIEFSGNNGILSLTAARNAGIKKSVLTKTNIPAQKDPTFFRKLVIFQPPNDFDKRLAIWNQFKAGA